MLFLRALLAFVMLPGVVAGLGPMLITRRLAMREEFLAAGFAVLGVGLFLLLWCVRDFYVAGKGTLAPWDPPQRLVVVGLYRFVRNPMYVGVATVLAGWALLFRSPGLVIYLAAVVTMFHLRLILYEEPTRFLSLLSVACPRRRS